MGTLSTPRDTWTRIVQQRGSTHSRSYTVGKIGHRDRVGTQPHTQDTCTALPTAAWGHLCNSQVNHT